MTTATPSTSITGVQQAHQAALDAGRFLIQHCRDCNRHIYYPRECCPHCGSAAVEWAEPNGRGTVHAVTTVRRKPADGGDINVSIIELDEGVRLMGRVDNLPPEAARIGQRVTARVQVKDGRGLVVFDVVEGALA